MATEMGGSQAARGSVTVNVLPCPSRDAAVTYKETLEKLNAPESALIITVGHNDGERFQKYKRSKVEQGKLIDRFLDPKDPLSLLVVCDMLLTGFDAPVEQVMYLDSPLREHTLLQAIAVLHARRTPEAPRFAVVELMDDVRIVNGGVPGPVRTDVVVSWTVVDPADPVELP